MTGPKPDTKTDPTGPKPDPKPDAQQTRAGDDARMDAQMGRLLQVGVLLASATVLVGGASLLFAHAEAHTDFRTFRSEPATLRHLRPLASAVAHGDPAAIIQLGVLLLIATPIARVAFAAVSFLRERDWLYVAVSLTVLAVLLLGVLRVT